jgi:redox-sensitive bicupin YhaK (pirin superfamily)
MLRMSIHDDHDDAYCIEHGSTAIDLVIQPRPRDLGGFFVRRVLPAPKRRLVGPFIFFDHMGPMDMPKGEGINVRPHPHIALATVTYLFSGEIFHRDSLGSAQAIHPGDVNWMSAGRGITHSERTRAAVRETGQHLHGIQAWVALPLDHEESEPAFYHHPEQTLPHVSRPGVEMRVIAGSAFGHMSPVKVASPTLYVDASLAANAHLNMPDEHEERALYVVNGAVECEGEVFQEGSMLVLRNGVALSIHARDAARVMLLGGEKLSGERHIYWNFVSSSKERIERAKQDWKQDRFPKVVGDEIERIPLPE